MTEPDLTKKEWAHIISVLQMNALTGNQQSQKLYFKLVEKEAWQ